MKRRKLSPFAITQILMAAIVIVALWLAYWPWRWGQVREEVRRRYPAIIRIESEKLQKWMENRKVPPPLLLDTRNAAEYDYSHLRDARRVVPGLPIIQNGLMGHEASQIVVYDTVGFQSGAFAADLLRQGFKDVQVLDGGIFLWANEGRPLAGKSGNVDKLRPGLSEHVPLLDRSRRAE